MRAQTSEGSEKTGELDLDAFMSRCSFALVEIMVLL